MVVGLICRHGFNNSNPHAQATPAVLLHHQAIDPDLRGPAAAGKDRHIVSARQQFHGIEGAQHTGTEDQQAHGASLMRILQAHERQNRGHEGSALPR